MKSRKKLPIILGLLFLILTSAGVGNALIGPDQDLSDFPPWIWPIIRPVSIISKAITAKDMTFDLAAEQMKEAVTYQCDCFTAGEYGFKALLEMVNAQFDIQLATIKLAKTKVGGFGGGKMVAFDDEDWCGTPPRPWPWPPYLIDLVKLQAELFRTEIMASYKLTKEQINLLDMDLTQHVENFAGVLP